MRFKTCLKQSLIQHKQGPLTGYCYASIMGDYEIKQERNSEFYVRAPYYYFPKLLICSMVKKALGMLHTYSFYKNKN